MNKIYERITLKLIEGFSKGQKLIPGPWPREHDPVFQRSIGYARSGQGRPPPAKITSGPGYISSRLTDEQRKDLIAKTDIQIDAAKAAKAAKKEKERLAKEKKDK
jgi:hypothetical protein